jgi:hypothetical protein
MMFLAIDLLSLDGPVWNANTFQSVSSWLRACSFFSCGATAGIPSYPDGEEASPYLLLVKDFIVKMCKIPAIEARITAS